MKKSFFWIVLIVLMCLVQKSDAADKALGKRGNDEIHILAAHKVSNIEGVRDAAVLSSDNVVMVGVRLEKKELSEDVMTETKSIINKIFAKTENHRIFVGDENAEKVIELSFFIDTDMDRKILKKRFSFLAQKN